MPYKALTYIMLGEEKISPGDEISDEQLADAGQNEEHIAQLIEGGALSEDMDAPVHPDHQVVIPESEEVEAENVIRSGDGGSGNA
jgi:hypothetical protein